MEEKKIRATESGKIVLAIALSFISCMNMGTDMATT
jgi:hypothetical protein